MQSYLQAKPSKQDAARSVADADQRHSGSAETALSRSLNQNSAVQSQLALQRALNQRPAVVTQAKLAQELSGTAQRETLPEEEDLMQQKSTVQREGLMDDEDELMQAKFEPVQRQEFSSDDALREDEEEDTLQGRFVPAQRQGLSDEDELVQPKPAVQPKSVVQRQTAANRTGLPDGLKAGVEGLSGQSLDDVRVHYNSPQPATLQAAAYAQGTDIHVAPGQEQHLPHEAWHVVQQKQGRVEPTMVLRDVGINDDAALEQEADVLGARAEKLGFEGLPDRAAR